MSNYFVHPRAFIETEEIGKNTRIWAFAHVMSDVTIGDDCNIGDHAFIESGVRVGRGVTMKNGVSIWEGVEIADFVFIGPNVVFTNDLLPRSPRQEEAKQRYATKNWLVKTIINEGASIGANATIVCGVTLGKFCMIGAGSVVTKDIPPYALVYGNPARLHGYVNRQGAVLKEDSGVFIHIPTGRKYKYIADDMREIT